MRVGIDVCDLATGIVGVGSVIVDMLKGFEAAHAEHDFILYQNDEESYLEQENVRSCITRLGLYNYWQEQLFFSARCVLDALDVFHAPIHLPPDVRPEKTRVVFTVHDLHSELDTQGYYPKAMNTYFIPRREQAISRSDAIIVHSDFVKRCILEKGLIDESRITNIPLGVKDEFLTPVDDGRMVQVRGRYGLPERYILYVGSIEPWKRVPFLIESVAEYRKKTGDDIGLVIIGRNGWNISEWQTVDSLVAENDWVHRLGYIEQGDLPGIYQAATLFSTASMWEGFGIIFLEAMASGVPIVAPRRAAIPEVVGDAGLLYDADSIDEAVECFRVLLTDDGQYDSCVKNGQVRIKQSVGQSYGTRVLEVYEALV